MAYRKEGTVLETGGVIHKDATIPTCLLDVLLVLLAEESQSIRQFKK